MRATPDAHRIVANPVIAPGAHILVREAVWRVLQVNRTSTGKSAWHVVGVSELVQDQDAIYLQDHVVWKRLDERFGVGGSP